MGKTRKLKKIFRKNNVNKKKKRKLIFHNIEVLKSFSPDYFLQNSFMKISMRVASQVMNFDLLPIEPTFELNEEKYINEKRKIILNDILNYNEIDYEKFHQYCRSAYIKGEHDVLEFTQLS